MRKLLYAAIVATVLGSANPVSAFHGQVMYRYYHSDNGVLVGESEDQCRSYGVVNVWLWGYATSDIDAVEWAQCVNGQVVPLD